MKIKTKKDFFRILSSEDIKKVALVCHVGIDYDSLLSNAVMKSILEDMGKQVFFFAGDDRMPKGFEKFSEYYEDMIMMPVSESKGGFDVLLSLDSSRPARVGKDYQRGDFQVMVFDHHRGNSFPDDEHHFLHVDERASSTCQMVLEFVQENGLILSDKNLLALYAGMFSDTMGFTVATTEDTHLAAAFIKSFVDTTDIIQRLENVWTARDYELLPDVLRDLSSHEVEGKKVTLLVTEQNGISIKKLQKFLMKADTDILVVAIKIKSDMFRISFLSYCDEQKAISQKLALRFNGNGHANRAGGKVFGYRKDQLKDGLLKKIKKTLKK